MHKFACLQITIKSFYSMLILVPVITKMTWEDKSAAVKMTPAVMLLVRMGLASIIPRYQLTKPLLALRLAAAVVAAAAAVATEELEDESDEEEAGLVPLKRKEMRWDRM
jgi:hypothetical protein